MNKNSKLKKYMFQIIITCFNMMLVSGIIMLILVLILRSIGVFNKEEPFLGGPIMPIILMLVTSIIVGTVIGAFLSRHFFIHFIQLGEGIRKISNGDYDFHIDELEHSDKDSDLNNLIISFNNMVDKLKSTETLSSDFISNVSHEFKTPLMTIQGYVTLLNDDNLSASERKKYIDIITDATRKLTNLTSNILKISKLENDKIDIEPKEYNVSEQVRETIIMLEASWEKKNIDFDLSLPDCMIINDEELLEQVWTNIIGNAIKFSKENSKIEIYLVSNDEMVSISIRDYGIGMNEEVVKHIFDKFYQGDESHSSEGNGLGMTLVNKVCELCGGNVEIKSQVDVGTTIKVNLPIVYKNKK